MCSKFMAMIATLIIMLGITWGFWYYEEQTRITSCKTSFLRDQETCAIVDYEMDKYFIDCECYKQNGELEIKTILDPTLDL